MADPTYKGIPLVRQDDKEPPKVYFLNQAASKWAEETGRPIWEWLWEKEHDN